MNLQLDPTSATPIYSQVVERVKALVAHRALRPGDRMPSVRELAASLRINRNTAAKAYSVLEEERIVETRTRQGTFVSEQAPRLSSRARRRQLTQSIDRLLLEASQLGYEPEGLAAEVSRRVREVDPRKSRPDRRRAIADERHGA